MIAFKDNKDGYYQFDWDGVSELPEWTKDMTQIDVVEPDTVVLAVDSLTTLDELKAAQLPVLENN